MCVLCWSAARRPPTTTGIRLSISLSRPRQPCWRHPEFPPAPARPWSFIPTRSRPRDRTTNNRDYTRFAPNRPRCALLHPAQSSRDTSASIESASGSSFPCKSFVLRSRASPWCRLPSSSEPSAPRLAWARVVPTVTQGWPLTPVAGTKDSRGSARSAPPARAAPTPELREGSTPLKRLHPEPQLHA